MITYSETILRANCLRTLLAAALAASGMVLGGPGGIALADPAQPPGGGDGGRPGQIGGAPGSFVRETAKEDGSVPSNYDGQSPGQFVKAGTAPCVKGGPPEGGHVCS